jgi:hypothetical protein
MYFSLEVVSKPQIRFKGKASRALEAERTRKYVSISMRGTTQPLGLRWGFKTTSKIWHKIGALQSKKWRVIDIAVLIWF